MPPLIITIRPQAWFVITAQGPTALQAYAQTSFTVSVSAAPSIGPGVYLCMSIQAPAGRSANTYGTLTSAGFSSDPSVVSACGGSSALVFAGGTSPSFQYTFTYSAPLDPFLFNLTFLAVGPDYAHFMQPTVIPMVSMGPLLLPQCVNTTYTVLVSGAPDYINTALIVNGLYYVGAPINSAPHYYMSSVTGGP